MELFKHENQIYFLAENNRFIEALKESVFMSKCSAKASFPVNQCQKSKPRLCRSKFDP